MYFPSSLSPNTSLSGHHLPPTMLSLDNDLLMRGGTQMPSDSITPLLTIKFTDLYICACHLIVSWVLENDPSLQSLTGKHPQLLHLYSCSLIEQLSVSSQKKQFLLLIYNFFPSHFFEDFTPSVLFIYASKISFSFLLFLKTSFQAVIPIDFAWLTEISLLSQS